MDDKGLILINFKIRKSLIVLLVGIIIFLAVFYYLAEWPRPVVLENPPFPAKGVIASYDETSTHVGYSGNTPISKTYVWRKQFLIFSECCENLNSPESILSFLDVWLTTKGWVRWEGIGDPCGLMAETDFLNRGTAYVPYVPKDAKNLGNSPSVCVAVWPQGETEYAVLLVTADK